MLQIVKQKWTIILNGNWNTGILDINWLGRNVFNDDKIGIDFSPSPNVPTRFIADNVAIIPTSNSLTITPQEIEDENLIRAEEISCTILRTLLHTPIYQVGINFGFMIEEASEELLSHFPNQDSNEFGDIGLIIKKRANSWSFEKDNHLVNMFFNIEDTKVDIDFNFHRDVNSIDMALEHLEGKFIEYRDVSYSILNSIYTLEQEIL